MILDLLSGQKVEPGAVGASAQDLLLPGDPPGMTKLGVHWL